MYSLVLHIHKIHEITKNNVIKREIMYKIPKYTQNTSHYDHFLLKFKKNNNNINIVIFLFK